MSDRRGWHPDPGGARGRFRYWDGTRWSAETTDSPGRPAPGTPVPRPRRSRGRLVVAALAGAMVLVLLAVVVRNLLVGTWPVVPDPAPPTVIGRNDSSPTPTPTPSPSPSPRSPSPSPASAVPLMPCPLGLPNLREAHPVDDRVYGGNLSFPAEPSYRPASEEPRMSFGYDVTQQQLPVSSAPGWIAQLAVGQLRAESGFVRDPRNTAESLAQCVVTGTLYDPYDPDRIDVRSEATTITGREGWLIESEIRVSTPGLAFPGDRTIFLVVRDGADWGFFFGASPIGDAGLGEILDRTVAGLRAS